MDMLCLPDARRAQGQVLALVLTVEPIAK